MTPTPDPPPAAPRTAEQSAAIQQNTYYAPVKTAKRLQQLLDSHAALRDRLARAETNERVLRDAFERQGRSLKCIVADLCAIEESATKGASYQGKRANLHATFRDTRIVAQQSRKLCEFVVVLGETALAAPTDSAAREGER